MGILCKHKFEGGSSLHEWGERYTLRTQETHTVSIIFRYLVNSYAKHAAVF